MEDEDLDAGLATLEERVLPRLLSEHYQVVEQLHIQESSSLPKVPPSEHTDEQRSNKNLSDLRRRVELLGQRLCSFMHPETQVVIRDYIHNSNNVIIGAKAEILVKRPVGLVRVNVELRME